MAEAHMKKLMLILTLLPSLSLADVSIYRGLATTHLFVDNSYFNNDNGVTIVKVDDFLVGTMKNSYNEDGYFIGWQPRIYKRGRFESYLGLTMVQGYRRWQLPYYRSTYDNYKDKVTTILPVGLISYSLTNNVALQINNMAGIVVNAGVRIDF